MLETEQRTTKPVTSNNSDLPVHQPSMTRVVVHPSLDYTGAVEGSCDQRRLIRLRGYDPIKSHFNIVKLEFTGAYIIFLISARKT